MPKNPENVTPMTRYRGVVESTGEVIDIDAPAVRGRRKRGKKRMFALMDLEALNQLELTGQEWAVLHRVMRGVDQDTNEARVHVAEIAADLDIAAPNVSRIMGRLRERRIVYTLRTGVHRVNTHIMFRGSNDDWNVVTTNEREPQWNR